MRRKEVGEAKDTHGGEMKREGGNVKKDAHKAMHKNSTEENKNRHNIMKNKAQKAVLKELREKS